MKVNYLTEQDIREVLSRPSKDAMADLKAFNPDMQSIIKRATSAYPFCWSITPSVNPECICWYNVRGNKAFTSMYYTDNFIRYPGVTFTIKQIIEDNIPVAKDGGISTIEIHSTLNNPKSVEWYKRLGFTETDQHYDLSGIRITVFERRI